MSPSTSVTSSLPDLAAAVVGPVLVPGDAGYLAELDGFDLSVRHRPVAVVGALGAEDVVATVRFAAARGLGVAVHSTGHGIAVGARDSGPDAAVVVSTRRMDGFSVDPSARTARVEAGVRWRPVVAEAARHGLAPLTGSDPNVGVVAYTLGGGCGPLSRLFGYAADHVRAFDIVTADGEHRHVSPTKHPDLFWAVRGGKGNFGVVTALEFDLHPVGTFLGGGLFYPAEHARHALHSYRAWVETLPEETTTSFVMMLMPDHPTVDPRVRGRFATHIRVMHFGDMETGSRVVNRMRTTVAPMVDTVTEMTYADIAGVHGDFAEAGSFHINNIQLTGLHHATIETLLRFGGPDSPGLVGVEVRHLGGALARPPATPNAVAHRDNPFQLYMAGVLEAGRDDEVRAAQRDLVAALAQWNSGHRTLNFVAGVAHSDPAAVRTAYTDDAYERLVELKRLWDPRNMFRFNHNIPPEGVGR